MNLHYSRKFKNIGKRLAIIVLALVMVGNLLPLAIPAVNAADYECGLEAHTHTDECYELTCTTPVGEQYGEHFHGEGCYADTLTCECAEGVEHTAECYTSEKVCTLEEGEDVLLSSHTHADACFNTICTKTEHTHTEECGEVTVTEDDSQENLLSEPAPLADEYGELQITFTTNKPVGSTLPNLDAGDDIYIDWGDGNIVPFDSTATTKGDTIKLYSAEDITDFVARNCGITDLDFSANSKLVKLNCGYNALTELDLSANHELKEVNCQHNGLTELDLSASTGLMILNCDHNSLTSLDVSGCASLYSLACNNNALTEDNLKLPDDLSSLRGLIISDNNIASIDLSTATNLESLAAHNTRLSALDVSGMTALHTLICDNTNISALDLSNAKGMSGMIMLLSFENTNVSDLKLPSTVPVVLFNGDNASLMFSDLPDPALMDSAAAMFPEEYVQTIIDTMGAEYGISMTKLFEYAPQALVEIPEEVDFDDVIDLSSEYEVYGKNTVYKWYDGTTEVTPTTAEGGKFTFGSEFAGKKLRCEMTNENYPDLTLETTEVKVKSPYDGIKITVSGDLEWNNVPTGEDAPEVTVNLMLNDEVVDSVTVPAGTTEYSFADVSRYTTDGTVLAYTVALDEIPEDYEVTYGTPATDADGNITIDITGTHEEVTITVSGDIEWKDVPTGEDAPEVTVNLMLDGEVVDSVTVPSGTTEYSFADVSKFAADGTELAYTVELDEIPENYEVSYGTPAADADGNITIDITGTYEEPITYGELTISNTVSGEDAPTDAEFTYTVTFDSTDSYSYTGSATGTIKSGDKITLKNGESVKIANIPVGVKFTVTQDAVENFVTSPASGKVEGVIAATPSTAAFSNTYEAPVVTGNLEISNKVTGNNADTTLKFPFKVEFSADGSYEYKITNSNTRAVTTIKSGDTIELAHGETVVIYGLPVGTTYKVTETNTHGYKMTSTGDSGTVSAEGSKAAFINEKNKASGGDSNVPDTGDYGTSETVALYVMQIAMMAMLVCIISMKKLRRNKETEQF